MGERKLIRTMINRNIQKEQEKEKKPVQLALFDTILPDGTAINSQEEKDIAQAELLAKKAEVFNYMCGGNATFTIESDKLHKRYTYKVTHRANDKIKDRFIVKVLHGSDNESDYHYLGLYYADTGNGVWNEMNEQTKVFAAFIRMLLVPEIEWYSTCHFYKSGKCACCGRKLTVPESIETGIGPECAKRFNNHY